LKTPIDSKTIIESYTLFDKLTQQKKNEIIDDFNSSQPHLLPLFAAADKILSDMENEALIQLACIIWIAYKNKRTVIKKAPKETVDNFLKNNEWMKKFLDTDNDTEKMTTMALRNYHDIEPLKFAYSAFNGRWRDFIRSDRSAKVIFYTLKTVVDCLCWASCENS
jgi:hypothetical protein